MVHRSELYSGSGGDTDSVSRLDLETDLGMVGSQQFPNESNIVEVQKTVNSANPESVRQTEHSLYPWPDPHIIPITSLTTSRCNQLIHATPLNHCSSLSSVSTWHYSQSLHPTTLSHYIPFTSVTTSQCPQS